MQFHLIYVLLILEDVTTRRADVSRPHYCRICKSHNYEFPVCVIANHPPRPALELLSSSAATQTRRRYLIIQEMEIEVNGDGGDESDSRKKEILKHSDMALICKMSI